MAAGEYTSVASQAEYTQAEIEVERREIRLHPKAEQAELTQMYVDRGIDPALAEALAIEVHKDPETAVAVHAREEFGADSDNLPNPLVAAGSSFVAFAIGAMLPLLPFLLGAGSLLPAMVISLLALFGCGALVSRVTVRSWWYGGTRQLILGGAAAGLTYLIGRAVGRLHQLTDPALGRAGPRADRNAQLPTTARLLARRRELGAPEGRDRCPHAGAHSNQRSRLGSVGPSARTRVLAVTVARPQAWLRDRETCRCALSRRPKVSTTLPTSTTRAASRWSPP